jgi:hypothetical protein
MVNRCANPKCGKPLHYLREGRIFIFDMPDPNAPEGTRNNRREHFWLCGPCSQTLLLEQTSETIRVIPKPTVRAKRVIPISDRALAS